MPGGNRQVLKAVTLVSTIGIQFAVSVLLGYYGGRYLDNLLGTGPWLLLLGLLTGVGAGMLGVYHLVTSLWREEGEPPRGT